MFERLCFKNSIFQFKFCLKRWCKRHKNQMKLVTLSETIRYLKHCIVCVVCVCFVTTNTVALYIISTSIIHDDYTKLKSVIGLGAGISKEFTHDSGKVKVYFGSTLWISMVMTSIMYCIMVCMKTEMSLEYMNEIECRESINLYIKLESEEINEWEKVKMNS